MKLILLCQLPIWAKLLLRIKLLKKVYLKNKKEAFLDFYTLSRSFLILLMNIIWSSNLAISIWNIRYMCALYTHNIVLSVIMYRLFCTWHVSRCEFLMRYINLTKWHSQTQERVILPFDYRVTSRRYSTHGVCVCVCMYVTMILRATWSLRALIACVVHHSFVSSDVRTHCSHLNA